MYKVIMILQRGGYSWGVMTATVMDDGNCGGAGTWIQLIVKLVALLQDITGRGPAQPARPSQ